MRQRILTRGMLRMDEDRRDTKFWKAIGQDGPILHIDGLTIACRRARRCLRRHLVHQQDEVLWIFGPSICCTEHVDSPVDRHVDSSGEMMLHELLSRNRPWPNYSISGRRLPCRRAVTQAIDAPVDVCCAVRRRRHVDVR